MPITSSSARQVDTLIADLRTDDSVRRDAAVARLMVIGPRAVDRLIGVASDDTEPSAARVSALRALEGIGEPRALAPAMAIVRRDPVDVAVAAVAVIRGFLTSEDGLTALDVLTTVTLDRQAADDVREAAVRAIEELDSATVAPILEALLVDSSARLRTLAQGGVPANTEAPVAPPIDTWLDAPDEQPLPADAEAVRHELARRGREVPLPRLHRAIERIRDRESQVPPAERRAWLAARAAAHLALAQRGSRVALYDLRELLERADGPLPWSDLLAAAAAIGDAGCLESLADIHVRLAGTSPGGTAAPADVLSRHVTDAFRAIVAREKVTARSAVAKKITRKWPDAWKTLAGR